jgi:cobalamin biosynthesis Co2+ chelatase CbiK
MTHQNYSRKTKRFLSKTSRKIVVKVKKVSNLSFDSLCPFEELPSRKEEGRNASAGMNAFDLFQAYTSNIIRKNIIYAR